MHEALGQEDDVYRADTYKLLQLLILLQESK